MKARPFPLAALLFACALSSVACLEENDARGQLASPGTFPELEKALQTLPPSQAPTSLRVRIARSQDGRVREPRVDATTGDLLVDPASGAVGDTSIWLHEIAHVHAHALPHPKSRNVTSRRLRLAIEEGFADYYAASALESSVLGATYGREVRDLAHGPTLEASHWATMPFARATFDEHRFGSALAALAFREHGFNLPLARAGLDALRDSDVREGVATSPANIVDSVASASGTHRAALASLLLQWLPAELRPRDPAP